MGKICLVEVSKKQNYIFRTNKLKENIGASVIIDKLTDSKVKGSIIGQYLSNNEYKRINEGGGNGVYYFANDDNYKNFAKSYSKKILKEYPSIILIISSIDFNPENDDIFEKMDELFKKNSQKKNKRYIYSHVVDFGITKKCEDTRLPAISYYNGKYISKEIVKKLEMADLSDIESFDMKQLGLTHGDKSYIGVIHIDGNSMGKKVEELKNDLKGKKAELSNKENYIEYIKEFKTFSNKIKSYFQNAYNNMENDLEKNIDSIKTKGLNAKKPVRKIILAGDDVCFITDGRVALEASRIFLEKLDEECKKTEEIKVKACAGIAIVKEKYPFYRAYELAEHLCREAKNTIEDNDSSKIYWHILQGEYDNDFARINEHYSYKNRKDDKEKYTAKPYSIDNGEYNLFKQGILNIKKELDKGGLPKGKVKELMLKIRQSKEEAHRYYDQNHLYKISKVQKGNYKQIKDLFPIIFDQIEMLDYFIALDEEVENG